MRSKQYGNLRNFVLIARHTSLAEAAEELCLTKGALSHQLQQLEEQLGFSVFERHARGIRLSKKGAKLLTAAEIAFSQIEQTVSDLRDTHQRTLTIGVTTYFASRWLSQRLMDFIESQPDIRLRIQPMIDIYDLDKQGVDLAVRWGNGEWHDCVVEKLLDCPAWPTGNKTMMDCVEREGLESAFNKFTLLRDHEDSNAWSEWYKASELVPKSRADTLIIPDPNVRVQAVIDGQGVALNDELVAQELKDGKLFKLSPVALNDYGYFIATRANRNNPPEVEIFAEWMRSVRDS